MTLAKPKRQWLPGKPSFLKTDMVAGPGALEREVETQKGQLDFWLSSRNLWSVDKCSQCACWLVCFANCHLVFSYSLSRHLLGIERLADLPCSRDEVGFHKAVVWEHQTSRVTPFLVAKTR